MPWNHPANPGVGGVNPRPEVAVLRNHGVGGRVRAVFPRSRGELGRSDAMSPCNDGSARREGRFYRSGVKLFSEVFAFS